MPSASNIEDFTNGIKAIQKATKRASAEIVNRALRNVAFRAMEQTPYADPGKIQAELYRDKILLKMATRYAKKRAGSAVIDRNGKQQFTKRGKARFYKSTVSRSQIAAAATKLLKIRIARSKAIRAGWIPAVLALGGRVRVYKLSAFGGSATLGRAVLATPGNLYGLIQNSLVTHDAKGKTTGVGNIPLAEEALDRAIAIVAKENIEYAIAKISKIHKSP